MGELLVSAQPLIQLAPRHGAPFCVAIPRRSRARPSEAVPPFTRVLGARRVRLPRLRAGKAVAPRLRSHAEAVRGRARPHGTSSRPASQGTPLHWDGEGNGERFAFVREKLNGASRARAPGPLRRCATTTAVAGLAPPLHPSGEGPGGVRSELTCALHR